MMRYFSSCFIININMQTGGGKSVSGFQFPKEEPIFWIVYLLSG